MKFSEMRYERPPLEATQKDLAAMIDRFEAAATDQEALDIYREIDAFMQHIGTMGSLAYARHTLDTTDAFYDAEREFFDDAMPQVQEIYNRFEKALVASPHRAAMEAEFGALVFTNIEMSLKTFRPEIVSDLQQENKLAAEYDKLIASAQIAFDGKTLTLAQIAPYHQDKDRAVRKASYEARAAWFEANAAQLDELYDQLVRVRTAMARKMGYKDYIELGYYRMQRNCYDAAMVDRFRQGVREYIVPIASRLKDEQRARIGVERITLYDDAFEFPTGNAKPIGTPDEIFAHGKRMYHELSPETAEFIDFMLENELFDVLTRPGKAAGGYCTTFDDYRAPFIFANFNGTSGDIDVLTHEAGHAYDAYVTRDIEPSALRSITMETAEVHSMSMEFFTWPWMEGFFGDQTAKYRYSHLSGALTFLPYGTMVDEFQHRVYENPDMTPAQRNEVWLSLEATYRPYLDMTGMPFFSEGRRWQAQGHIYASPFYYIDYCLAQTMALAFWAENQKDHDAAWARYQRFIGYAGTKTFLGSVEGAGLPSPFEKENLKRLAENATKWLDGQPRFE